MKLILAIKVSKLYAGGPRSYDQAALSDIPCLSGSVMPEYGIKKSVCCFQINESAYHNTLMQKRSEMIIEDMAHVGKVTLDINAYEKVYFANNITGYGGVQAPHALLYVRGESRLLIAVLDPMYIQKNDPELVIAFDGERDDFKCMFMSLNDCGIKHGLGPVWENLIAGSNVVTYVDGLNPRSTFIVPWNAPASFAPLMEHIKGSDKLNAIGIVHRLWSTFDGDGMDLVLLADNAVKYAGLKVSESHQYKRVVSAKSAKELREIQDDIKMLESRCAKFMTSVGL